MKVLVTGGAGFIGSNLVRHLVERGDDVRVLDNFSTGSRANLEHRVSRSLRASCAATSASTTRFAAPRSFSTSALSVGTSFCPRPLTSNAVNVEGTLNAMLAARDEGVRRSSSLPRRRSTARPELPVNEALAADPISPYGVAKLAAERYCVSFSRVYESLETVVLRYFNVFGRRRARYRSTRQWCRSSSPRSRLAGP